MLSYANGTCCTAIGAVSVSFSDGPDDLDWPVSITNSRVEHVSNAYWEAYGAIYVQAAGPVTVTDTVVADSESAGIQVSVSELIGGSVNVSRNTVDGAAGFGIDVQASSQAGSRSSRWGGTTRAMWLARRGRSVVRGWRRRTSRATPVRRTRSMSCNCRARWCRTWRFRCPVAGCR